MVRVGSQLAKAATASSPWERSQRGNWTLVDAHSSDLLAELAAEWLRAAQPGHCAPTHVNRLGDCLGGDKGSTSLGRLHAASWEAAATTCLRRCARCARCATISLSAKERDCSWYSAHACNVSSLALDPPGFRTARVGPARHALRIALAASRRQRGCRVLFDRHIAKNGGTSMRASMLSSSCQYYGMGFYALTAQQIRRDVNDSGVEVACVEAHSPCSDDWYAMARALPCAVTILVRIRRPDAYYLSFFKWGAAGFKPYWAHDLKRKRQRNATDAFVRWVPRNLQTHILDHEYSQTYAQRTMAAFSAADPDSRYRETEGFCERAMRTLRACDVVCPLEDFFTPDGCAELLRSRLGLELPVEHEVPPTQAELQVHADAAALTREHAPCDWTAYEHALGWRARHAWGRRRRRARETVDRLP